MEVKDYYYEAIKSRTSRRTYNGNKVEDSKLKELNDLIDIINEKSKLSIKMINNAEKFLKGFKASYGMITGAKDIIALVGDKKDKDLKEKVGYYGEFIVLKAVSLGLGTCWVGGTYNKEKCIRELNLSENEELVCILTIGNVDESKSFKEKLIGKFGLKKLSFDESLLESDVEVPDWIRQGVEYARLAPSAINYNPVGYIYRKGELSCVITKRKTNYEEIDIGISMAHFKIGAHKASVDGVWERKRDKYIFVIDRKID